MTLESFARWGYFARAIVYLLVGCFAVLLFVGGPMGSQTDSKGALKHVLDLPFGEILLFVLACGLFCYAFWRFAQSFKDASHLGTTKLALLKRTGFAIGGMAHVLLGVYAIKLIFSLSSSGTNETQLARFILLQPFGQFLLGGVAVVIIGFGAMQVYSGIKNKFEDHLALPSEYKPWLCTICKFGFLARGFVFMLIGSFFLRAAFYFRSGEAGGVSKAWTVLQAQPFGNYLILIVAVGFIAFAIYGFAESRYHKQFA